MTRYIIYGINPWVDDTILGEFTDKNEALLFELEEKMKNKEDKNFAFITSKVML